MRSLVNRIERLEAHFGEAPCSCEGRAPAIVIDTQADVDDYRWSCRTHGECAPNLVIRLMSGDAAL